MQILSRCFLTRLSRFNCIVRVVCVCYWLAWYRLISRIIDGEGLQTKTLFSAIWLSMKLAIFHHDKAGMNQALISTSICFPSFHHAWVSSPIHSSFCTDFGQSVNGQLGMDLLDMIPGQEISNSMINCSCRISDDDDEIHSPLPLLKLRSVHRLAVLSRAPISVVIDHRPSTSAQLIHSPRNPPSLLFPPTLSSTR